MKAFFVSSFRNRKGSITFKYRVVGTPSELEAYEEAQGEFFRQDGDTGEPLWFTGISVGPVCDLIITSNGNVVADTSELDMYQSLTERYGGNFGQEMAKVCVGRLMAQSQNLPAAPSTEDAEASDDELSDS